MLVSKLVLITTIIKLSNLSSGDRKVSKSMVKLVIVLVAFNVSFMILYSQTIVYLLHINFHAYVSANRSLCTITQPCPLN